jgi:hypothetical protein
MPHDTIPPLNVRARFVAAKAHLLKKPLKWPLKVAIALVILGGIRHLNTVPLREWLGDAGTKRIVTRETLFGSYYAAEEANYHTVPAELVKGQGLVNGNVYQRVVLDGGWNDVGIRSKVFSDVYDEFVGRKR